MKEIGGYLELECRAGKMLHKDGVFLNSGQSGLRCLIRANNIKKLWIPYYTCPVINRALQAEGCCPKYYKINASLCPQQDFSSEDFVLLNNYFGVCGKFIERFAQRHKRLIVDNAQSFYSIPQGIGTFYSPRKFFGVPDGGIVFSSSLFPMEFEQDCSWQRCSHLLKRWDEGAEFGYADFKINDAALEQAPVRIMSKLTKAMLEGIDYFTIKQIRKRNFSYLDKAFSDINQLHWARALDDVPMCYPLLLHGREIRTKLIERKIFVPCYWPDLAAVPEYENELKEFLLPLPIDQRYNLENMKKIVEIVKKEL